MCIVKLLFFLKQHLRGKWCKLREVILKSYRPEGFTGPKTNREGSSRSVHSLEIHCSCHVIFISTLGLVSQPFYKTLILRSILCRLFVSVDFPSDPFLFTVYVSTFFLKFLLPLFFPISPLSTGLGVCWKWSHFSLGGPEPCNWTSLLPDIILYKVRNKGDGVAWWQHTAAGMWSTGEHFPVTHV